MQAKHSLSLAFVLLFRKHVFISFALCLMRNKVTATQNSLWDGRTENVMLVCSDLFHGRLLWCDKNIAHPHLL